MEALKRLSDLQVVSRVTKELENHLNIAGDQGKTLAEFVIEIARGQKSVDGFKAVSLCGRGVTRWHGGSAAASALSCARHCCSLHPYSRRHAGCRAIAAAARGAACRT
jgi:hypothetical protein